MVDLKRVSELYSSLNFPSIPTMEMRLIQGFRNDILWTELTNQQKIKARVKKIEYYKKHFRETTSEIVFEYEESVVGLCKTILTFIDQVELIKMTESSLIQIDKQALLLFRLKVLLYCELYSANKHEKIKLIGHVPYELVAPLFDELRRSVVYEKYGLKELEVLYKKVYSLYLESPYSSEFK